MIAYIEHNKTSQATVWQQAATPENVSTRMAHTNYYAYICMFTTLFNYTMEKKNKKESLNEKPSIPVAERVQSSHLNGEISYEATVRNYRTVQKEGNNKRTERWLR